jgi:hypothetical protein
MMIRFDSQSRFIGDGASRVAAVLGTVRSQPNWMVRLAAWAALIVLIVPVVLLGMLALVAGVVTFTILAAASLLLARVRKLMPRDDGRANVRVIERIEAGE